MEGHRKSILFVIGTRPEAIKMAPVILAFRRDDSLRVRLCVTAQHREMLDRFLAFFGLRPDTDLNLMSPGQSLPDLTARAISGCGAIYRQTQPDLVFVQGDTATAFAAAISASLSGIPVAHVEAGLRSGCRKSPFPEETNRILISHVADLHFAPTPAAAGNLRREGIFDGVHVVGNTGIDALKLVLELVEQTGEAAYQAKFPNIDLTRAMILITLHRRESLGAPLERTCRAIRALARAHPRLQFIFPVHLNPLVRASVVNILSGAENILIMEPLGYPDFVWLISRAALVLTDSGGVVEEAATLGVPLLVAREATERSEAIAAGARMVGFDPRRIVSAATAILAQPRPGGPRAFRDVFGDGCAAERIVSITNLHLAHSPHAPSSD